MAGPASKLPPEDQSDIRPHDIPELRASEGVGGGRSRGDHASSGSSGSAGRRSRGDHSDSSSGGGSSKKSSSPSELDDAESEGDNLYNNDDGRGRKKRRFFTRKKAAVGGILGIGALGTILFSSITQGPLQLIHLDEILQRPGFGSNQDAKLSLNQMYRYYRSGSPGETRVSATGSRIVAGTLKDLKAVGIEFQTDSFGHIKSATFDTGKLRKNWPELDSLSEAERRAFVARKMGIPAGQLQRIGTGGDVNHTKFAFNNRDAGVKATRLLTKNSLEPLENGKVMTSIKFRVMAKFFNTPSLFHPIERANANAQKKLNTRVERKQALADEEERQKKLEKPTLDKAAPAAGTLRDKLRDKFTVKRIATATLLVTSGMCFVREVSDDVVAVNFGSIVMPSTLQATDKQAVGEQAKSGQDIDEKQAGGVADSFVNENGQSIWTGKALQALAGSPQTGEEIPHDYQQAFNGETSAQGIRDYLGGGGFGDAACSTPGKLVQVVIGVGIIVSGFFDAGASWGAKAATLGAEGAKATATAGAVAVLQAQFTNLLANKAIVPQVLNGPLGGNLLAYGARSAANMSARAGGGVALSATASAALAQQQQQEDQHEFRSKSYFARIFDVKDYRSLTGRMADSLNPSLSQNATNFASGFMNIGSWLPHTFSAFLPRAHADQEYDWGFKLFGVPPELRNNPELQDPYVNADKMAEILDSDAGQGYIDKAKKCFGKDSNGELIVTGDQGWDVMAPADPVNPNSDEYMNAGCDDLTDLNWDRTILFVADTLNWKAVDCYQGNNEACKELGINNADTPGGDEATATTTAGATIDMAHLYDSSVSVACAPNTKDLGIQDGYTSGKKIKIRICAVSNLPSTGEESNGNYGVSGADGKAVVNSRVSGAVYAMVEAAKAAGIPMGASSSFRTMSHQQSLCAGDSSCSGGDYTYVAMPGTSNHQLGAAIDFEMADQGKYPLSSDACVDVGGRCEAPGDKVWEWLNKNASKFDYKPYVNEFWHWSPDGH